MSGLNDSVTPGTIGEISSFECGGTHDYCHEQLKLPVACVLHARLYVGPERLRSAKVSPELPPSCF